MDTLLDDEDRSETEQSLDDKIFSGDLTLEEALRRLRLRLLDLTGRNRLLNFKHSIGKSLRFVSASPEAVFARMYAAHGASSQITPVAEPPETAWVTVDGRSVKPDAKNYAETLGIDSSHELPRTRRNFPAAGSSGNRIQTLYYAEDLGRHCRKIEREAKLAIEETGANMLHLVFGFLEYPENSTSDKVFLAPLICLPVRIDKDETPRFTTFSLVHTGEELAENLSLREKLERDFGLNIPEFDEDESLGTYFDRIEEAIEGLPQWRLRRMLSLTLLSFTNMLLVKDLDPSNWASAGEFQNGLLHHPIVRRVFEGVSSDNTDYGEEYAIDDHTHAQLPLIYDADSSQHSALIDAIDGKNLVIEGPPGTGKSQTITNLISAALHSGKKVLFVSEKLAALEVVKARLAHAGLEHFVLELHSNKTNKKRVIEDIDARCGFRPNVPAELNSLLESAELKRKELKAYADLLNGVHGNCQDLTVHEVLWRAEKYRLRCGESAVSANHLVVRNAPDTTSARFRENYDALRYVSDTYGLIGSFSEEHPLWGFYPEQIRPADQLEVTATLSEFGSKFQAFAATLAQAGKLLHETTLNLPKEETSRLATALAALAPADQTDVAFELLPRLFRNGDATEATRTVHDVRARLDALESARRSIEYRWAAPQPADDALVAAARAFTAHGRHLEIAPIPLGDLYRRLSTLAASHEAAVHAIDVLSAASEQAGLPFGASPVDIERLLLLVRLAEGAPDEALHLRHEGLRHPQAHSALVAAGAALEDLQKRRLALEEQFYLDMAPDDAELRASIFVLREGSAWYRIFQSKWRRAISLHKRLARVKDKKSPETRLRELESLLKQRDDFQIWRNDKVLREIAGSAFDDERTPLKALQAASEWVDSAIKALHARQIGLQSFDPINVDVARLFVLRGLSANVSVACSRLSEFSDVGEREFAGAPMLQHQFDTESWSVRLAQCGAALDETLRSYETLAPYLKLASMVSGDVLGVVETSRRIPRAEAELNNHAAARNLLGRHFAGCDTKIEPIEGALAYGQLVKAAKLPRSVEHVLLSERTVETHAELSCIAMALQEGWAAEHEFAEKMGRFGAFDRNQWACSDSHDDISYANRLAEKTQLAEREVAAIHDWSHYVQQRNGALKRGLGDFVSLLEKGSVPAAHLPDVFGYRFYSSIAQTLFAAFPQLSAFSGVRHSAIRAEFSALDKEIIKLRGQQVAVQCIKQANPPRGFAAARVAEKTEMALIDHLVSLQVPRTPVRQILRRAGKAVQELKPCFMMGPQAVAQFLAPGRLNFDIVVMDEASQLKPEEAIGAIARGKQLIVVGDPKQLPPTSFFTRQNQTADGDESSQQTAAEDAESILDICLGHFHPVRTLRWHYRSRHESLIAFSNHHFYKGNLFVFPSPYPKGRALGLHYMPVKNGVYENQMNRVEAARVVDAVVAHVCTRPQDSLGVVTLNIKQRDLIAELWDERRKSLPQAEEFERHWTAEGMELFIKNLENVQGDERDCILISTTFGKVQGAQVVRQNFGPISRQGGWRRLNVLFTRARKSIGLITSMEPEDIVADGSTPAGTKALRHYLEYARNGLLPQATVTGLEPDSDFEVAVIDLLQSWGYQVTPQLGVAGFRIDIGVNHPDYKGAYLAAIECDGATYHSGVSVRDRDRIRQEILESLGWRGRIWRIWSTDWFRNPKGEGQKLRSFLENLKAAPIPSEFLADVLSDQVAPNSKPEAGEDQTNEADNAVLTECVDLFDEDDNDLEVDVGDIVSYVDIRQPNEPFTVRITSGQTDGTQGLLSAHTPLAQIMLGAAVGDTVVLRVPGQSPREYVIKAINRTR